MKVLIIRFSSIGDIVLTSPVIRCIKQQTNAEIHYLTKGGYASILHPNPYISKVITLNDSLADLKELLDSEQYDFVVDLHKNIRSRRVIRSLGVPNGTFNKANVAKWLKVNFKTDYLPKVHIVERYFQAVEKIDVTYDGNGLDYFLPPQVQLPERIIESNYAVVAIGGAHETKKMPALKLRTLCEEIEGPVVLIGGPEDEPNGKLISDGLSHVTNLAGALSLSESAKTIEAASVVVTHDTGMMHVAAAFKKPTLSIWGNTIPGFGMYPFYPKDSRVISQAFEVMNLRCRPCSKIGFEKCPKKHFNCMNQQNVSRIATATSQIISSNMPS